MNVLSDPTDSADASDSGQPKALSDVDSVSAQAIDILQLRHCGPILFRQCR